MEQVSDVPTEFRKGDVDGMADATLRSRAGALTPDRAFFAARSLTGDRRCREPHDRSTPAIAAIMDERSREEPNP